MKQVLSIAITIVVLGPWLVSAAGSALASGGSLLIPASIAGTILALHRWRGR